MSSLSSIHASLSNHIDATEQLHKPRSYSSSLTPNLKPQSHLNELVQISVNKSTKPLVYEPYHRIYIFDFDDTIFPTSIIQKNIKIWDHTESSTIAKYKQCHTLYITIKKCIEYIINLQHDLITKYGAENISFLILTNASVHWLNEIKNDHSSLISQLLINLQSVIPIISAKDEFESKYDDWYSECCIIAKTDSLITYLQSLRINDKKAVLYCIGDGKAEFYASKDACQEVYGNDYILQRIQLKSNRKAKNKSFKTLGNFYSILVDTKQFLFNDNEELKHILEGISDNEYSEPSEDNNMTNIIDYKL